jgi:hypothetical protein
MPLTDQITDDEARTRRERAVAAAAAAGRALGLTVTDPHVLHDVFSVVVHLRPAPVVARVPTVLPRTVAADPVTQAAQQRRELAVAGWLPSWAFDRWTRDCYGSWNRHGWSSSSPAYRWRRSCPACSTGCVRRSRTGWRGRHHRSHVRAIE